MMAQKPILGFSLALLATATWGTLPLAAQQVLKVMDAQTLVWGRFWAAAIVLLGILAMRGHLPKWLQFSQRHVLLLLMGVVGLTCNFTFFAKALNYISPTTIQVLWQLAPFAMMTCGIIVFKETLGRFQKIGALVLVIGLIAFFNDRFAEILQLGTYALGVLLGAAASIIWVVYAVAQKLLLKTFSSAQILMMLYFGCGILLTPIVSPSDLGSLNGFTLLCFVYCCANTLIAYGAYGESLNHWDASKISVITTMLPIFTMLFSLIAHWIAPTTFPPLAMNTLSYLGAFIVVAGAILAAVGDKLLRHK
ncbi:DMT family transporter [Wielerella bovis]|uniref:DMT family transporter n=1 Tax=Wielerella bovis TaxID=2917790 RepID=UPI002018C03B|nr:DMT family transporter [Wielerella bovis]MCG7658230.1 DMT family transporter [Wielerella bovis]